MGKSKKEKSKKHKKHKKHSSKHSEKTSTKDNSSNDSKSGFPNEVVWSEKCAEPLFTPQTETDIDNEINFCSDKHLDSKQVQNDDNEWCGLLSGNTVLNFKKSNIAKNQAAKHTDASQNRVRYSRELNPFFKDDTNKRFIENPEDFWKNKNQEIVEQESDSDSGSENCRVDSPIVEKEKESKPALSDAEKNAINAKIIKAEIMGNMDLMNELKEKLKQMESRNIETSDMKVEYYARSKKLDCKDNDEKDLSVKEMFYQTKKINTRDEISRFIASSSKLKIADEEYEDIKRKKKKPRLDTLGNFERVKEEDSQTCGDCQVKLGKHLILRLPQEIEHCYLAFTPNEPFIKNYCLLKSTSHQWNSTLECDEQCWSNIRQSMRLVSSFFEQHLKCSTIFMETYFLHQKRALNLSRKHFVIECVPIKKKYEHDARIFFNKEIQECGEEWSMNKKLIKLEGKSITSKIPKGLSYFWVSFGPNFNGFAHVIEDENYFRKDFGKEVIGGFHDIEPTRWIKPRYESYEYQMKRVINFKNNWNDFISKH